MEHPTALSNLKNRISRLYVDTRSFKRDSGESVDYDRLVLEILIKGETFPLEFKIDKKDKAVLVLSDFIDDTSFLDDNGGEQG
ncbi:hypothetical protein EPN95_01230 [Patescibacteria group bacterium]|nr:MAG: hypothetical protein EPN95_01230 [Patescibacteria group bacterium]